jgi:hypothetical protein
MVNSCSIFIKNGTVVRTQRQHHPCLHSMLNFAPYQPNDEISPLSTIEFPWQDQCFMRYRLVTLLCLLFGSGGTQVLLACPPVDIIFALPRE